MCVTCFVRAVVTGGQVGHRHWRKLAAVGSWAHARRTRQVTRPGVLMGRTTAGWRRHAVSWRQCILMFEGPRCDTEAGGGINGHRGQMLSSQGANSRLVSVRRSRVPSGRHKAQTARVRQSSLVPGGRPLSSRQQARLLLRQLLLAGLRGCGAWRPGRESRAKLLQACTHSERPSPATWRTECVCCLLAPRPTMIWRCASARSRCTSASCSSAAASRSRSLGWLPPASLPSWSCGAQGGRCDG